MPTVDDLGESKYLKQSDIHGELIVVIDSYTKQDVSNENEPPKMKYCINFVGDTKPLVLNKTNGELIAMCLGSKDFDHWIGKQITLYVDPTIMFGGEMKGGIRVKYPPTQNAQQFQQQYAIASPPPPTEDPRDFSNGNPDDIPF